MIGTLPGIGLKQAQLPSSTAPLRLCIVKARRGDRFGPGISQSGVIAHKVLYSCHF
jgi:hypothetical protein